jgi:hypothetical protein
MTYRIAKSQIFPGFEVAIAAHAKEMRDWRAHMIRVREDENNGVTGIDRHVAHPRPGAHPLVEAAVNENDVADYEIVDDGPTPEQILTSKKNNLMNDVSVAEASAIAAISPPLGKQRLLSMRENDIRVADGKIMDEIQRPGLLAAAAVAVGISKPVDTMAEVLRRRPAEDTKFLEEQADRRERTSKINRAAAQMHSDIEDLTLETIDAWKMPPFPN